MIMHSKKIIFLFVVSVILLFASFTLFKKNTPSKQLIRSEAGNTSEATLPPENQPSQKEEILPHQKICPTGFVLVPGDPLYATDDFCIMKYEAKCASTTTPAQGIEPSHGDACSGESSGHYYTTYKNSGKGCACTGNKQVVSTQSGFPIAYIPQSNATQNNAKQYCSHMGWHLITNNEWMTTARNVEKVSTNWCDSNGTNCNFSPGTKGKILANGHNDNNGENGLDSALVARDDSEPCFRTTTDGSNTCGGKSSQKRTLTLSNDGTLWDFAGNVWEWIDATVARKDQPHSATNGIKDTGWLKSDFAPGSLGSVITDNGQGSSLNYDAFRPSNSTWNATNGVGRIHHYTSVVPDTNTTAYAFIRSGNWKHGADDGAFTIHLSPEPSHSANDVGFRCTTPAFITP